MRNDSQRLKDILQSIVDLQDFVTNMDKPQFLKIEEEDRKTFRAVCNCISTLGEAVKKLSPEIVEANDHIDWPGFAGMRDIFAHQYFRVQLDRLWITLEKELPDLKEFVEAELSKK